MIGILLLLLPLLPHAIQLTIQVPPGQHQCFGDVVGKHVLVVGSVMGNTTNFSLRVNEPTYARKIPIHFSSDFTIQPFSFTINHSIALQFCINNMDQYNLNATFRYTTGADAFDYTVIADIGDLEPVTILVKMLGDIMRALKGNVNEIIERQHSSNEAMHTISMKFIVLSLVTLVLMILTTCFSTHKIKQVLRKRKLI